MPISPNFTSIYEQEWEINFLQCYPNGYLKYTEVCNLFQITASKHAELGGISFLDMQQFHQAWVLSKMRVEIQQLPKWGDTILIKTWINSLENSRSIRCMEMYLGDKKIIGCETFWAVFNTQTRRPENLALPNEHFKKYSDRATVETFRKITIQPTQELLTRRTVRVSDLDIVNHVNSVKYLEWCLDVVPFTSIQNKEIESFEMNYLKELSLGNDVEIFNKACGKESIFSIYHDGKANFALQLNLK